MARRVKRDLILDILVGLILCGLIVGAVVRFESCTKSAEAQDCHKCPRCERREKVFIDRGFSPEEVAVFTVGVVYLWDLYKRSREHTNTNKYFLKAQFDNDIGYGTIATNVLGDAVTNYIAYYVDYPPRTNAPVHPGPTGDYYKAKAKYMWENGLE